MVAGDVGGYTLYTDRWGRKTLFPQSPPTIPPSAMQIVQRSRFQTAVANWVAELSSVKRAWERMSLRANVVMTGHNLYVSYSLSGDQSALNTLISQTGVVLPLPVFVPWA